MILTKEQNLAKVWLPLQTFTDTRMADDITVIEMVPTGRPMIR